MIIQYRGFNNNWCYTEADTISWAQVDISNITQYYLSISDAKRGRPEYLEILQELHSKITDLIIKETNCEGDIIFINDNMETIQNVYVVMLSSKNDKPITYVFSNTEAYILNQTGKTIKKLI